jgi:hypothetical protein
MELRGNIMQFVNITVCGLNPSPNSASVVGVHVVVTDAGGNVVFDDVGTVGTSAPSCYLMPRLDADVYTITAQAQDEHGAAHGPQLTLSGVTVADDTSTLPSFAPVGIQVNF